MEKEKIGFLFDLDGVLIDSESEYTRIWSTIERRFPTGIENFAIKIKGQTLPEILNSNFEPSLHEEIVGMLNDMEQKMHYGMLPGAREMLDELQRRGIPAALVTSSNELKMQHLREEQPDLEGCFESIITADKVMKSKPDPEGYLLGAKSIGAPARRCVVFEDSAQGVRAGRSAGAYVVGLTTTLPREAIAEWCDRTVGNLAEVDLDELIGILQER